MAGRIAEMKAAFEAKNGGGASAGGAPGLSWKGSGAARDRTIRTFHIRVRSEFVRIQEILCRKSEVQKMEKKKGK